MLFHQLHNSAGNYSYNAIVYDKCSYKAHFHKNIELIYLFSGSMACTVGEHTGTLLPGDFALVLPNEIHAVELSEDGSCWIGVYSGDFTPAFVKKVRGLVGDGFIFRCQDSVTDFLKANLLKKEQPSVFMIKACLYAVFSEYERQIRLMPQSGKQGMLMNSITDYIAVNFRNKITLRDMASELGYSYHYLSKCFHRIFDMSFSDYINMYRLEVALTLLSETDKDIIDVAMESGFQSIRSFNDYFLTHVGVNPSTYRHNK